MALPEISVVVPVLNEAANVEELARRLVNTLQTMGVDFEIILVDDGSTDACPQRIREIHQQDNRVKGLLFSRNFGQHHAITAGLDHAQGMWVVVMDGDLQDLPEEIPQLYARAQTGFDVVFASRQLRQDSAFKRYSSRIFFKIFNFMTGLSPDPGVANFSIIHRRVVEPLRYMREAHRMYPFFVRWLGFRTDTVKVRHGARHGGTTNYTLARMLRLAVNSIISNSNLPMSWAISVGMGISLLSVLMALWLVVRYLWWATPVPGWTSVMVSIIFFGGLSMAQIGVMGLYMNRIYDEQKRRPLYIVRDRIGTPEP
ncbi:MAG: glycosyltransferase family 2 protein [Magnetococcus sp. WYHC-3]